MGGRVQMLIEGGTALIGAMLTVLALASRAVQPKPPRTLPKSFRVPQKAVATLKDLVDATEDILRVGLARALALGDAGSRLKSADHWNDLVLPGPS